MFSFEKVRFLLIPRAIPGTRYGPRMTNLLDDALVEHASESVF